MPRTTKSFLMDTGLADANIPFSMVGGAVQTTGPLGASLSYSDQFGPALSNTAAGTATLVIPINAQTLRSGMQDDLEEAFGTGGLNPATGATSQVMGARGRPVYPPPNFYPPINFTTPAGASGAPPFPGASQLTPQTSPRLKGVKVNALTFLYQLAGAATTNSVGLTWHQYPQGSSALLTPVANVLMPLANNGMALAANTGGQIYSTLVQIPNPQWATVFNSAMSIRWTLVTTVAANNLYQVIAHCTFNYN